MVLTASIENPGVTGRPVKHNLSRSSCPKAVPAKASVKIASAANFIIVNTDLIEILMK